MTERIFFTCQIPSLSGRINFDPFSKTPKIPMNYSKNGLDFATSKTLKMYKLQHA